jgi:hypothetical protein
MIKKISLFFLSLISSWTIQAQEFTIKQVELTSDQVLLHYDLLDTTKNRTYTIHVYSSRDNFLAPLTKVSGDAGLEVKPGLNRKVTWNSKEELGPAFEGNVALEIRGRVYIPFIRFEGFEDVTVRKRKVPFIVKWSGGTRQNILNFQLYNKEDKLVADFPNAPNDSEYKITIPTSVKPGEGYYFKISDTKNSELVVITSKFDVKRKVPLALKAIPVLAVGGLIYFLASGSGNGAPEVETPPTTPPNQN